MKSQSSRRILLSSVALASMSGLNLSAQSATNAPARLPEVVVTAPRFNVSPSLTVPSLERTREELLAIPGGVNVITAEEYLTGRASTLKDVLDYTPGVFIQPRFGAEESRLSIRGSGLQRTFHGRGLKLMQDGVPLNLADGGFDMQAIEPLSVRHVEVYRGANALRFGSTTLGGAINYVSPTGHDADPLQLRYEAGSFGYHRGQISSGMALGNSDYHVSLTHFQQEGFRQHADQLNWRVFSNFGQKLRENVETRFYYTYVLTDSELPGSLTKAQLEADPTQTPAANVALNQKRDFELHRIANKTTFLNGDRSVELNSFWSHKDLFHPLANFPGGGVIDQNSNDFGVEARYRNTAALWGRENELTLGLAPTFGVVEAQNFVNVGGQRGAQTADARQQSLNLDLYGENVHALNDRLSLVTGLQFSYAVRDFEQQFGAGTPSFDVDYWAFNPKIGLLYELQPGVQLFGNVSRSFEPPSHSELGAVGGVITEREAQTATTLELGTRGGHGRFSWDLAWYHSWLEDELVSTAVPGFPGLTSTLNASSTTHQGFELGTAFRVLEGIVKDGDANAKGDALVFRQTYLWSQFRFADDGAFGDNQQGGFPEHYYRAELNYVHPSGFYAGPNVEWTPVKYPIDHANTFFADPYALLGFKLGYRAAKGFSAFVEVRNLTDKRYVATTGVLNTAGGADAAQFLPGDGRAVYTGIEWRW